MFFLRDQLVDVDHIVEQFGYRGGLQVEVHDTGLASVISISAVSMVST